MGVSGPANDLSTMRQASVVDRSFPGPNTLSVKRHFRTGPQDVLKDEGWTAPLLNDHLIVKRCSHDDTIPLIVEK